MINTIIIQFLLWYSQFWGARKEKTDTLGVGSIACHISDYNIMSLHPTFWWTLCRTICPEGVESPAMGPLILGPPGGPGAPGGTILLPRGLREPGVRYKKNVLLFKLQSRPRRGGVRKCDQNIIAPVTGSVELRT